MKLLTRFKAMAKVDVGAEAEAEAEAWLWLVDGPFSLGLWPFPMCTQKFWATSIFETSEIPSVQMFKLPHKQGVEQSSIQKIE